MEKVCKINTEPNKNSNDLDFLLKILKIVRLLPFLNHHQIFFKKVLILVSKFSRVSLQMGNKLQ